MMGNQDHNVDTSIVKVEKYSSILIEKSINM